MRNTRHLWNRRWLIAGLLLLAIVPLAVGCARSVYRHRADAEAYCLIGAAERHTPVELGDYRLGGTCQSRYFDAFNPDRPPMPPDDPQSHKLMHCVDGKHGWPFWDANGRTRSVENPAWLASLPRDEEGWVVLDRGTALRLALNNSRDYQRELENLYLSALDVTFQRFRFDVQFFGGNDTFFVNDGLDRAGGAASTLLADTSLELRKLFASGGELAVGIANGLVWQFSGPDDYAGLTLIDFTFVQPLLRGAGRAVVLENLTDAERGLLANTRQMGRYQKGFYANIITGRSAGPGPSSSTLSIDSVSGAPIGASTSGGIYALLEEQIRIRNQRANVRGLQSSLDQFVDLNDFGRVDRLQVDQVRQQLFSSQSRLLSLVTSHENSLDSYKQTLGLPPELPVRLSDPLLDRFNLIDPELSDLQEMLNETVLELRALQRDGLPLTDELLWRLRKIHDACQYQRRVVDSDFDHLLEALPTRCAQLDVLARRPEVLRGDLDRRSFDVPALLQRVTQLARQWEGDAVAGRLADYLEISIDDIPAAADGTGLTNQLELSLSELNTFLADAPAPGQSPEERLDVVRLATSRVASQVFRMTLVQALARVDTATLADVEVDPTTAAEIACRYRLDWMNARAALVDVWRQIQVAANDLRSGLDVVVNGDVRTIGDDPLRFKGSTGRIRVGLEFDAPLTRLVERNLYRRSLINYAQARRSYYTFEDRVNLSLRRIIRDIDRSQVDFELQRAAVHVAISQVDLTRLRLERPPAAGSSGQLGATTARDLVQALSGLLSAQNEFLGLWVNYESQRLALDLDMGTMQLAPDGSWLDPGPIDRAWVEEKLGAESEPDMPPMDAMDVERLMPFEEPVGPLPEPIGPMPVPPGPLPAVDGPGPQPLGPVPGPILAPPQPGGGLPGAENFGAPRSIVPGVTGPMDPTLIPPPQPVPGSGVIQP